MDEYPQIYDIGLPIDHISPVKSEHFIEEKEIFQDEGDQDYIEKDLSNLSKDLWTPDFHGVVWDDIQSDSESELNEIEEDLVEQIEEV